MLSRSAPGECPDFPHPGKSRSATVWMTSPKSIGPEKSIDKRTQYLTLREASCLERNFQNETSPSLGGSPQRRSSGPKRRRTRRSREKINLLPHRSPDAPTSGFFY